MNYGENFEMNIPGHRDFGRNPNGVPLHPISEIDDFDLIRNSMGSFLSEIGKKTNKVRKVQNPREIFLDVVARYHRHRPEMDIDDLAEFLEEGYRKFKLREIRADRAYNKGGIKRIFAIDFLNEKVFAKQKSFWPSIKNRDPD